MVFGHIRGFQLGENGNLLDYVVYIILGIFDVDDFDGHGFSSSSVHTNQDMLCEQVSETMSRGFCSLPFVHLAEAATPYRHMSERTLAVYPEDTYQCTLAWCRYSQDR